RHRRRAVGRAALPRATAGRAVASGPSCDLVVGVRHAPTAPAGGVWDPLGRRARGRAARVFALATERAAVPPPPLPPHHSGAARRSPREGARMATLKIYYDYTCQYSY